MECSERDALLKAAAESLEEISVFAKQLSVVLKTANSRTVNGIYRRLEAAERERDQRVKSLIQHEEEHSCGLSRIPQLSNG